MTEWLNVSICYSIELMRNFAHVILFATLLCLLAQSARADGEGLMEAMKKRAEPLLVAMGLLGTPYKLGGTDPAKGVDCSGLVHYVYKQSADLNLPHSAKALSQNGTPIKKDELKPGDLVFFHTLKKHFSHVGIYAGDGNFIHASSREGKEVIVSSLDNSYWAKRFDGARRILQEQSPQ
jgi:cell wall-associated NlpC family hydrolase